jgi:SAM-dependent methyltransferase
MKDFIEKYLDKAKDLSILEIGTCGGSSYKPLFDSKLWKYTGIDTQQGYNVDIVVQPYSWSVPDNNYDIVVSGQCLEHVEKPWLWIKEVERVCKPQGYIVVIVPWAWHIHKCPVDCWRVLPDGLMVLFTQCADLEVIKCEAANTTDTLGIARKK